MKSKTAMNGYADPKQQRLPREEDFTPTCGVCGKELEWSEEIAEGLCMKCKKETYGKHKVNDW